jgi:bifunctional non-homologous end joining protein LigD
MSTHSQSLRTARLLPRSKRKYVGQAMLDYIEPQLCTLVDEVPKGEGWAHEIELDGYRMQARVSGVNTVLRSRQGLDWTQRFPEIANSCNELPDCIIDGEICATDEHGIPSFSGLQDALSNKRTGKLIFFVFDLLFLGMEDYRPYALETRKKVLADLLHDLGESRIKYHEHQHSYGATMFKSACELKLAGIVSKRIDAPYISGRAGQWTKTKCTPHQELVIGGWETNNGTFSSLMLGAYRGGKFHYVGTARIGFNSNNLPPLLEKLRLLIIRKSPFELNSPKPSSSRFFVKKKLVCEVAFESWTRSGKILQASFKGLREDKNQSEVIVEEINHE